jgi:release factor glutamine methyltransferase
MNRNLNNWTVLAILRKTTEYFKNHQIENPRLNAEKLLSFILNLERIQLYLQYDRILTPIEIKKYRSLVQQRARHTPLQYLIGIAEFMGISFKVSPNVLIPRPETEILVEKTLLLKDKFFQKDVCIWDIGTGSGNIAVSLAHYWQTSKIIATDVSLQSLAIAKENAQKNGTLNNIRFMQHDILRDDPLKNKKIDIIVSNPPYVSNTEFAKLDAEIREFEPQIALTDFEDGLVFYHRILSLIRKGVNCKFILLELSGTMTTEIRKIVSQNNYKNMVIYSDLNNIPRVIKITVD